MDGIRAEEAQEAKQQRIVIAGYCWGAKLAILTAQKHSADLSGIIAVHPSDVSSLPTSYLL